METKRSSFSGKIGFVLAAAGSAVGLGNLWRFPYLAAGYGGGIFLLTYIILALTFGFALMTAEIAIGRKTGLSAVGAFRALDKRFSFIGYLGAIIPMIILPYYSVIGGWVAKYFTVYITGGGHSAATDNFFSDFACNANEAVFWFALYIAVTAAIVLLGVEKGVEKVSKIMMPVLVVLTVGIAIYSCCMPGAWEGVLYYVTPDFTKFSFTTVLAAMGQLFYSMSLAMGIMITYGSYMKKDVSIESSVKQIELFDTGIAMLAGFMIIPAVFAIKGEEGLTRKGAGLMFEVLPQVFEEMPGGSIVGAVFFLLVLFAALTSSISLMETVVSILRDKLKWGRKFTCIIVFVASLLIGIPSALASGLGGGVLSNIKILGKEFLDFFDFLSNSVLMPIVAFCTCIFVGYVLKPSALVEEVELTGKFKKKKMFSFIIKYVAPVFILLILGFSVLEGMDVIKV